eukprot:5342476-Pyramimonas_sp.AAC.1
MAGDTEAAVMAGDVEAAVHTHRAFFSVWQHYGFTPEGFHLVHNEVQKGQQSYPLRPELAESTFMLYIATEDPAYLKVRSYPVCTPSVPPPHTLRTPSVPPAHPLYLKVRPDLRLISG